MNNGFSREIEKPYVSTSVEHPTSLQVPTMGSMLLETTLEGATTVSEATQSKPRQKRFISILPLFITLLMKNSRLQESERAQSEVQKSFLAPLTIPFYPFLPQPVSKIDIIG